MLHHITARGDRRDDIYEADVVRKLLLLLFENVWVDHNFVCHSYLLMSNHDHLLVKALNGNLSVEMRQLNGVYAQLFNSVHNRATFISEALHGYTRRKGECFIGVVSVRSVESGNGRGVRSARDC